MKKYIAFLFVLLAPAGAILAQVQQVRVETYYVSDANDATDTTGGHLPAGSKTYRVFVGLAPGSRLTRIYGDAGHTWKIQSTAPFFNNAADGQTFAKDFSKNRYEENTVALDSWLTIGQTTRASSRTWFGVPKNLDRDGSFIGGINNDGGSAGIPSGLLVNEDPDAGIPLTQHDGMDTLMAVPSNWTTFGIVDQLTGTDSTIFGSAAEGTSFVTNNAWLQNSGVAGAGTDSNWVLVAQLTTLGALSFELNVEVEEPFGNTTRLVNYVARLAPGETNTATLKVSPWLKFPPECGCTDPEYLEYNASYACSDPTACHTKIVFGCMDTMACNYDPFANYHVVSLCCYPGLCNDRDISVVCPDLKFRREFPLLVNVYPNPARSFLQFQLSVDETRDAGYAVYDAMGKEVVQRNLGSITGLHNLELEVSSYHSGMYFLRIRAGDQVVTRVFIKE